MLILSPYAWPFAHLSLSSFSLHRIKITQFPRISELWFYSLWPQDLPSVIGSFGSFSSECVIRLFHLILISLSLPLCTSYCLPAIPPASLIHQSLSSSLSLITLDHSNHTWFTWFIVVIVVFVITIW